MVEILDKDRIVETTRGFAGLEDTLLLVTLPNLEEMQKVAKIRGLPVLHNHSEGNGAGGSSTFDFYAVIDKEQGTVYRFDLFKKTPPKKA